MLTPRQQAERKIAGAASAAARRHGAETSLSVRQGSTGAPSKAAVGMFRVGQARPDTRARRGVWDTRTSEAPIGAMNAHITFHFPKAYHAEKPDAPSYVGRSQRPLALALSGAAPGRERRRLAGTTARPGKSVEHRDVVITNPGAITEAQRHPVMRELVTNAIGVVRDHQKATIERAHERHLIPEGTHAGTVARAYKHAALHALHKAGLIRYATKMDAAAKAEFKPLQSFMFYAHRRVFDHLNQGDLKGKWVPFRDEFGQLHQQKKHGKLTGLERMRMSPNHEFIKVELGNLEEEDLAKAEAGPKVGRKRPAGLTPSPATARAHRKLMGAPGLHMRVEAPAPGPPPIAGAATHIGDAAKLVEQHFGVPRIGQRKISGAAGASPPETGNMLGKMDLGFMLGGPSPSDPFTSSIGAINTDPSRQLRRAFHPRIRHATFHLRLNTQKHLRRVLSGGITRQERWQLGATTRLGKSGVHGEPKESFVQPNQIAGGMLGGTAAAHVGLKLARKPALHLGQKYGHAAEANFRLAARKAGAHRDPIAARLVRSQGKLARYITHGGVRGAVLGGIGGAAALAGDFAGDYLSRKLAGSKGHANRYRHMTAGGIVAGTAGMLLGGKVLGGKSVFRTLRRNHALRGAAAMTGASAAGAAGEVAGNRFDARTHLSHALASVDRGLHLRKRDWFGPLVRLQVRRDPDGIEKRLLTEADVRAHARAVTLPTPGQAAAGNFRMLRGDVGGLPISIENHKGQVRRKMVGGKVAWKVKMPAHYGYIRGTKGADGDHVDVYLGPHHERAQDLPVHVIDQHRPWDGKFDEHKCMVGFQDQKSAIAAYDAGFSDGSGPRRRKGVTAVDFAEFKRWVGTEGTKKKLAKGIIADALEFGARQLPKITGAARAAHAIAAPRVASVARVAGAKLGRTRVGQAGARFAAKPPIARALGEMRHAGFKEAVSSPGKTAGRVLGALHGHPRTIAALGGIGLGAEMAPTVSAAAGMIGVGRKKPEPMPAPLKKAIPTAVLRAVGRGLHHPAGAAAAGAASALAIPAGAHYWNDHPHVRALAGAAAAGGAAALISRGHARAGVIRASRGLYTTGVKDALREHMRVLGGGTPSPHMFAAARHIRRQATLAALTRAKSARKTGLASIKAPKKTIAGAAAAGGFLASRGQYRSPTLIDLAAGSGNDPQQ